MSHIFNRKIDSIQHQAFAPMEEMPSGMETDAKFVHPSKAPSPIDVTLSGMVTDVKPLQPRKASCPIDVTLSGMVTDVKPLQPEYLQRTDS